MYISALAALVSIFAAPLVLTIFSYISFLAGNASLSAKKVVHAKR